MSAKSRRIIFDCKDLKIICFASMVKGCFEEDKKE
jgi:hypothetical protein